MNIYDHALQFKKKLDSHDKQTLDLVGLQYNRTLYSLNKQFLALAEECKNNPQATKKQLNRLEIVKNSIKDIQKKMDDLHIQVADTITASEKAVYSAVSDNAEQTFKELNALVGNDNVKFGKININAFEKIIGFTADGSPLKDILDKHSPFSEKDNIINVLREGVLRGKNPKQIAKEMVALGYKDKAHALTVARTETMRVAHEVGIKNYKANGIKQVQWVSAETTETCAVCWSLSGKIFDIDKLPHDHPNGRCSFTPYLPEIEAEDPEAYKHSAEDNFADLSEEEKKRILGKKRFEMWKNGELALTDLATITQNDTWGDTVALKPADKINDIDNIPDKPKVLNFKEQLKNIQANVTAEYENIIPENLKRWGSQVINATPTGVLSEFNTFMREAKSFNYTTDQISKYSEYVLAVQKMRYIVRDGLGNKNFVNDVWNANISDIDKVSLYARYLNFKQLKTGQDAELQQIVNERDKDKTPGHNILVDALEKKFGNNIIQYPSVLKNMPDTYGETFIQNKWSEQELYDFMAKDGVDRRRVARQLIAEGNRPLSNALNWLTAEIDIKEAVINADIKFSPEFIKKYQDYDNKFYTTLNKFLTADQDGREKLLKTAENKIKNKLSGKETVEANILLRDEYKRIIEETKPETQNTGEIADVFKDRYEELSDEHKKLFKKYLQAGNIDTDFDDTGLSAEQLNNKFYISKFDLAIKMQDMFENGIKGYDLDFAGAEKFKKFDGDKRLLTGELKYNNLKNMSELVLERTVGSALWTLMNGEEIFSKAPYRERNVDYGIKLEDLFDKDGTIKPVYKIITESQNKIKANELRTPEYSWYPGVQGDFDSWKTIKETGQDAVAQSYLSEWTYRPNTQRSVAMRYVGTALYESGGFFMDAGYIGKARELGGDKISLATILYTIPVAEHIRRSSYDTLLDAQKNGGEIPGTKPKVKIKNGQVYLERGYIGGNAQIPVTSIEEFLKDKENNGLMSFSGNKKPFEKQKILKIDVDIEHIFALYPNKLMDLTQKLADNGEFIVLGFDKKNKVQKKVQVTKTVANEPIIDPQFEKTYNTLTPEEKEIFAPYLEKGKVDKDFDDSYMPEEEKTENEFYISSLDLALKMQRTLSNVSRQLAKETNPEKIEEYKLRNKLFSGKLSKAEYESYDDDWRKRIIGKTYMNIFNGSAFNKVYYSGAVPITNIKIYDEKDPKLPQMLPDILFDKNGKIKPIYKIVTEAYKGAYVSLRSLSGKTYHYADIDAIARCFSTNYNGQSWSSAGGCMMGIARYLYNKGEIQVHPNQSDDENYASNIALGVAFERMRRNTYHDLLTGNYDLTRTSLHPKNLPGKKFKPKDTIRLFHGEDWDNSNDKTKPKQTRPHNNGLTSWAPNLDTPSDYGSYGVVWEMDMPIERIFAFWSGQEGGKWSIPSYEEVLVIGGSFNGKQVPKNYIKKHYRDYFPI